ncbi:MAG: N-acetyltransferase [Chitinophagales bacterium]|nr:N-acetyltransferase [Chitinophagales bacterium]
MINQLIVRTETFDDFEAVFNINHIAFGQDGEAKLVEALRKNLAVFIPKLSIVATLNDEVVGHILFTKITIKSDTRTSYESIALAPMAVKPEFQKSGIGGQLITKGLEEARDLGFQSVIVLGHEHYYPKFGFEPAVRWNIKAPFEVPVNAFMAIELVADGLKDVSGTVIYPKEFDGV